MSRFNYRDTQTYNPNIGFILVVVLLLCNLSGIYVFSLGSIFPLAILWPLTIWQINPFRLKDLLALIVLSILQDFIVFDGFGTNLLINLQCLIIGYAIRKLTSFIQVGSYIEIIIMSLIYVLISSIYSILNQEVFDLLSLVFPIGLAIILYPKVYKFFYFLEEE